MTRVLHIISKATQHEVARVELFGSRSRISHASFGGTLFLMVETDDGAEGLGYLHLNRDKYEYKIEQVNP